MKVSAVILDRAAFLGWLVTRKAEANRIRIDSGELRIARESVALVWLSDSQDTPLLCIDGSDTKDFFAFTDTYLSDFSPISAFFQVLPIQYIEFIPPKAPVVSEVLLAAIVGCLLADASAQLGENFKRLDSVSIQASLATPSAVGAMATLYGYDAEVIGVVVDRFEAGRSKLGLENNRSNARQVGEVWSTICRMLGAIEGKSNGSRKQGLLEEVFAAAYLTRDENMEGVWEVIARSAAQRAARLSDPLRGPREERVRALTEFAQQIQHIGVNQGEAAGLMGFLTALAGEGSMSYLPLVSSLSKNDYATKLWFGFASGLNKNSDVLSGGGALGRRLLRLLPVKSLEFEKPQGDMSMDHLMSFGNAEIAAQSRREVQSVLKVELMPGVIGRYRVGQNSSSTDHSQSSHELRMVANQIFSIAKRLEIGSSTASAAQRQESGSQLSVDKPRVGTSARPKARRLYKDKSKTLL